MSSPKVKQSSPQGKESSPIVAVGLDLKIPQDEITKCLTQVLSPEVLASYTILPSYKTGIMFSSNCKLGCWTGLSQSQAVMEAWYRKHQNIEQSVYFTRMYITDKVILLDGTYDGKFSLQLVVSNMTKGAQTLFHRKNAINGHYGKPITIDRIEMKGLPYVYHGK
jgi:hypothetical protein